MRGGKSASFFFAVVWPLPPLALEVTETSTQRKVATGRAATTLKRGLRDAAAGSTSDRVRRIFRLPFPSFLRQHRSHAGARLR
jgi:hypothetical protein